MSPQEIKDSISFYKERLKFHSNKINEIRKNCTFHKNIVYNKYKGDMNNEQYVERNFQADTGNYCKQDDSYWCIITCKVCGCVFIVHAD